MPHRIVSGLRARIYRSLLSSNRIRRRWYIGAFLVIAAAVLVVGIELRRELGRDRELRARTNASYETRLEIQRVFSLVQDAETGQRGYALTGQPAFLEPYEAARLNIGPHLDRLGVAFDGRTAQQANLAEMRRLIRAKFERMSTAVALRDTRGEGAVRALTADGRGKAVMDAIRVVQARMVAEEARELSVRTAQAEQRTHATEQLVGVAFALLVGVFLTGALVIAIFLRTRHDLIGRLRQQSVRQRAILDAARDGIFIVDGEGIMEDANPAGGAIFGWPPQELKGRSVRDVLQLTPEESERLRAQYRAGPEADRDVIRELVGCRRDGDTFPVDLSLSRVELASGRRMVAIVRDATERKRVEQMKTEFVSTVSHELRTPLTSISGSLGLLAGGAAGELPARAGRLIQIAESNCRRLVRLINDILDMDKIESGQMRFDLRPLDLREVARRSIDGVRGMADEAGVRLELASGPGRLVQGDDDRLVQVVTNLLSNAVKYSPRGRAVRVAVEQIGEEARLSVADRGPGISADFRDRIFGKFAQADSSDSRAKGGTGLGLAIAREIAERHGGRLSFDTVTGQGTTFNLDLPALLEAAAPMPAARGRRVLVCEDDPGVAAVLRDMLTADGFSVEVTGSAVEARRLTSLGVYDGLILDLKLPDGDGLSLLQALRATPGGRTTPVIVVSADTGGDPERLRMKALDVVDWMDKPIERDRLRAALSAAIGRAGPARPVILHVDDDPDLVEVAGQVLAGAGEMLQAGSLAAARIILAERRPDLVILDLGLPDGSGVELLADLAAAEGPPIPTVVYSAREIDPGLVGQVDAVLTKSRTPLPSLAKLVHALARRLEDAA